MKFEAIDIINCITGVFYIVIGFAVYYLPVLIAGYNTMSKEEKEKIDIVALKRIMRNSFIYIGIFAIVSSILLGFTNWLVIKCLVIPITGIGIAIYLISIQNRFVKK